MPYGIVNTDTVRDSNGGILAPISSVFRNRIINGAMVIDQRNAGASITVTSSSYAADRWEAAESTAVGGLTAQQVSDAPAGFVNSLKITTSTAATAGAAENAYLRQFVEGYNVADLGWGTADAKTITISFWVKSSLTGTFSGGLFNAGADRSYVFTYTINSANTWEYETITIPGDTSGTWNKTNGRGIGVVFDLGSGSNQTGTANSWTASLKWKATGSVSVIGTLNATWQTTGVQLEVGSSATGFEYVNYQTSLANCQRYYEAVGMILLTTVATNYQPFYWAISKRTAPTLTLTPASGTGGSVGYFSQSTLAGYSGGYQSAPHSVDVNATVTGSAEL